MSRLHRGFAVSLLPATLAFALPAAAANLTWPGAAPCDSTLQACIDGAADNDTIYLATDAVVTDDVSVVNRRLRIRAADGHHPLFRNMHFDVETTSGHAGSVRMHVYGLRFEGSTLTLSHAGSGSADYEVRKVEMRMAPGSGSRGIEVLANAGTVDAHLYDNRVTGRPLGDGYGLISLKAWGGTLNVRADYNHLASDSTDVVLGSGIVTDYASAGSGELDLHANEVRGSFNGGGIMLSEGGWGGAPASMDAMLANNVVVAKGGGATGIRVITRDGSIDFKATNNTVIGVRNGVSRAYWSGVGSGAVTGWIWNNLVVGNETSMWGFEGVSNDYNLLNGDAVGGFTPGSHTITAPAMLESLERPRPQEGSPALDAGDAGRLLIAVARGIPLLDADGLHRLKKRSPAIGGPARVDIGAYEYGDFVFTHTATADTIPGSGELSWLSHPAINGMPAANLFATPNLNAGNEAPVTNSRQFIPWWDEANRWALMAEGGADPMPVGAHFDVLAAGVRGGVFRHTATAANTSASGTLLDDPSVNDKSDLFVLVARNSSLSQFAWNPHPLRVYNWFDGSEWVWFIKNADGVTIAPNVGFSVYTQDPSPNAFTVSASSTTLDDDGNLVLHHPLLNGMACARPVVTLAGIVDVGAWNVAYDQAAQRWVVFRYGAGGVMPTGAKFNVLVDPKQVESCSDRIFADDFEF